MVRIESRFNPEARGGSALGLMQIKMPDGAQRGVRWRARRGLMAPDTNLHFGMKVLADAYRASRGDVCMTLASTSPAICATRISAANRVYCARARAFMAKALSSATNVVAPFAADCLLPGGPVGRTAAAFDAEESPGSTEKRCRITSGEGDPRESATESRPPGRPSGSRPGQGERVR